MKWRNLLAGGMTALRDAGSPEAAYDARELLAHVSGMNREAYLLHMEEEAPEEAVLSYRELTARRAAREPLQYITGSAPFYGYEFSVRPGVLIPRFDTETLVSALLPHMKAGMSLLDLCTGSGCVLLTCLLEGPEGMRGIGCDVSETALSCAAENAEKLGVSAEFVRSDLFAELTGPFDIISANPPYIRTDEIPDLPEEVRDHEPRLALDGEGDGLAFYRRIIAGAPAFLTDNGVLGLEIGCSQADDVEALMRQYGFRDVRLYRDLAGLPRTVTGVKADNMKTEILGNDRNDR